MVRRRLALSIMLVCSAAMAAPAAVQAEPRAVLELFTSQGCSSCPAADKLAGEFALDSSLVVMSIPIDYWDYLGWKDTLAIPGHAMRQRAYARARGDRQVYTPQMVVNGGVHVLGSDATAIERAIQATRKNAPTMTVPIVTTVSGDRVIVRVSAAHDERGAGEIWLCAIAKSVPVTINRGENRGRTVTYHNVTRRWVKLGEWTGKAASFTLPIADVKGVSDVDTAAAFVQGGAPDKPGAMLGASIAALR